MAGNMDTLAVHEMDYFEKKDVKTEPNIIPYSLKIIIMNKWPISFPPIFQKNSPPYRNDKNW